ncbi:MAG TPA: molybdopterin cofactor-binding domain-containing protein, partial [Bryobacteraceae bacterium]|nr:molybdopterin cofactor-binding domain-containing protein [Bryobacteraceae bacterium]
MQDSLGKPLVRVDGRAKVTGRAVYTAEQDVPNAAYAVMVTSSIARGRIVSLDTRAAERQPGVLAVLSSRNTPRLPQKPRSANQGDRPGDRKLQLLQEDTVYYAGQPVAVVVAESLEAAQEGARLVEVRYAAQTPSVELEPSLSRAYKPAQGGAHGETTDDARGAVDSALASAEVKLDRVYTTPFQVHNPMEPHATIAIWSGPDRLTVYDATQGPFPDRERFAMLLGLKPDNVRVICPYLGGGFGSKGPTWSSQVLAAIAAKQVGRPVKLVVERPQMFGPVGMRSHTRQRIAAGARRDGTLVALRHDVTAQTSSFDEFLESAAMPTRMLYAVPNEATTQRLVRSDIGTPSFMRAPGWAAGVNVLEIAMDEMAYEAGMDPIEFRLKNYADQDPEKSR